MRTHRIVPVALSVVLVAAVTMSGGSAGASRRTGGNVEAPTVTGPVTGGNGAPSLVGYSETFLAEMGYVGEEFFLDGTATSFAPKGVLKPDGKWKVAAGNTAPYTTRMVVYRPESAGDFSGTVFVEWLNVSAGFDSAPDWLSGHTEMVRAGAVWIGVSAQAVGVQGGQESVTEEIASGGIKAGDPERYGTLNHPGDAYSYDIFSQTGVAARNTGEFQPLGDFEVERVIAVGESQAAFRMVTYVNAVHPRASVFDGFLIHSRGGSAAGFDTSENFGADDDEMPDVARIRRDVDVPVLTFQTESDLTRLGSLAARQRDSRNFRLWEVAGTAHADVYTAGLAFADIDQGAAEALLLDPAQATGGPLGCAAPINAGPAFAVLNAALFQLERWVADGVAPPRAPRLATDGEEIARDEHDNAQGGIRTPLVDVPIATNNGEPNEGGSFCTIFGLTVPFDAATLAELYRTHDDYVEAFNASADEAVEAGFWLETDAEQFMAAAAELPVPS